MKVVNYKDVEELPVDMEGVKDTYIRWLITDHDGALNFAMRLFRIKPGGHTPYHKHPYEHEVFVLSGKGRFVFEGKEYEIEDGSVVFVDPDKKHQFVNVSETEELKFICVIPLQK